LAIVDHIFAFDPAKSGAGVGGAHEAAGNCPAKVDEKGRLKIPAVFLDD